MTSLKIIRAATVSLAAWLTFCAAPSKADFLTSLSVDMTAGAAGRFRYDYTLTNLASSTLPAVQLALSVSPEADLADIAGPSDWLITYQAGDTTIDFLSLAEDTDLLAGSSATFSFTSGLGPVDVEYLVVGFDFDTVTIETNQGLIAGPGASAVPEPSSLTLCGIAVLAGLGYARRRTKRPSSD